MIESIVITMTGHCFEERRERLIKMDKELGFGEIICTTIYRGTRNCLTSTGILMVLDLHHDILITAYPARWKIARKMFFEATGNPPPKEYSDIIRKAKAWDCEHNWI